MHRKGRPANRLPLSCAFFSLMRYLEYDSTVNSNEFLPRCEVFYTGFLKKY